MKFKKQSEDDLVFDLLAVIIFFTFIVLLGGGTILITNMVVNYLQGLR
jgi:hypothetical protein